MRRKIPAPRPANAPFKRTFTAALLAPLAFASLAQAADAFDLRISTAVAQAATAADPSLRIK